MNELIDLLKTHDWYYSWSDDHSVYQKGEKVQQRINSLVKSLGAEGKALYNKYAPKDLQKENTLSSKTVEKSDSIMHDLKGNKREFVKRYGKNAEKVMKGRAIEMAKKKIKETATVSLRNTIREVLKEAKDKNSFDSIYKLLTPISKKLGYSHFDYQLQGGLDNIDIMVNEFELATAFKKALNEKGWRTKIVPLLDDIDDDPKYAESWAVQINADDYYNSK
jgi:hypothetical protein